MLEYKTGSIDKVVKVSQLKSTSKVSEVINNLLYQGIVLFWRRINQ